jgi:aconitate hydratase
MPSLNSFKARSTLSAGGKSYTYFDLQAASANCLGDISKLPMSLKVLVENLLRAEDGVAVKEADILAMTSWLVNRG